MFALCGSSRRVCCCPFCFNCLETNFNQTCIFVSIDFSVALGVSMFLRTASVAITRCEIWLQKDIAVINMNNKNYKLTIFANIRAVSVTRLSLLFIRSYSLTIIIYLILKTCNLNLNWCLTAQKGKLVPSLGNWKGLTRAVKDGDCTVWSI